MTTSGTTTSGSSSDLHKLVSKPLALVGRENQLAEAITLIERRASALLLVAGEVGMGKSTFLAALDEYATGAGWTVARSDETGELTIAPSTTPPEFDSRLRQILGWPAGAGIADAGSAEPDLLPDLGSAATAGDAEKPGVIAKLFDTARRWLETTSWLGLAELIVDLQRHAPVLILIDGYRPGAQFERSFAGSFLPVLLRSTAPLVVVVADRPEAVERLAAQATARLDFGPGDQEAIRRHFARVTRDVEPAIRAGELDAYADAAAHRPELIGSLTRLLALQRPEGT
jgi:hypothetical protein